MKKVVTVLGARPQFIKASVVSHALAKMDGLTEVLVHTGQHFDPGMSEVFFSELEIAVPDYQLDIHGGSHGEMTGRMLSEIERVLTDERPDAVMVYGDTNSTLAGALAAVKLHIPVAHVEAGLRSFNMLMPEEVNRILTDRISRWLFTPTQAAVENLESEGIGADQIEHVGDVMFDVAQYYGSRVNSSGGVLKRYSLRPREYVLATIHRAENTDRSDRLNPILGGLIEVAASIPVVWPMHPRTRNALESSGFADELKSKLLVLEPVGYLEMVTLEKNAAVIATDSGGVQKEAFFHHVPCVTLRDETEWVELVAAGWNRLVQTSEPGAVAKAIIAAIGSVGREINPYGEGNAAQKIAKVLAQDLRDSRN